MAEIEILIDMEKMKEVVKDVVDSAIPLDRDTYGNPRYYVPSFMFTDIRGKWFRPANANAYRGKKYGDGWAFQSYNLKRSIEIAFETEYNVKIPD